MVHNGWGHVGVLSTTTDRGEQIRTRQLHQVASEAPHWEDHNEEVAEPKSKTLLAALNPHRVEMHVEFGGEVTVEDRVDILEMVATRVLV